MSEFAVTIPRVSFTIYSFVIKKFFYLLLLRHHATLSLTHSLAMPEPEPVTRVNITDFIRHFEFQVAKCVAVELGELNETVSALFHHLKHFRTNECDTK